MELSDIIMQKIRDQGPICFREYMEMCLYYPELGYYTSGCNQIGIDGDFYTSSTFSPVFGAMIGKQLEEMWHFIGETEFTIIEYGAGTGSLCYDILCYLKGNEKMYDKLRYCIIEKSPAMRAIEQKHLNEKVEWYATIAEIGEVNGCILSNELVDNFSVHQVVMKKELMEVYVTYQNGFKEELRPADKCLKDYFTELRIELPEGYRTEVNLEAITWISDVAGALNRGYVLTIDYGSQSSELYKPYRSDGTLLCYNKHDINALFYNYIGKQDITSHVNFSALSHWGTKNGLKDCGITNQCNFLLSLGFRNYILHSMSHEQDVIEATQKIAALNRTLLMDMGSKFKVLIQEKGLHGEKLSGLAHL